MYRKNPKLKKIEQIYSPRRDGFSHPEKCDTCDRSSTSVAKEKAKSILRFVKEGNGVNTENGSLYERLLEIVSGSKLLNLMAKNQYNSILRSEYTVKDRSRPPRVESRLPRVEVGTSIGIEATRSKEGKGQMKPKTTCTTLLYSNVAKVKLMFKRVYLKKIFALLTIIAVIITAYFQNTPQTQAATN